MGDRVVWLVRESAEFVVVANEGHAGIVCLVLFLQVDERPHASVIQRLDPPAMIGWIRTTWVSACKQQIVNNPIRAVTRRRLGWVGERVGDTQSKSPMERGRLTSLHAAR